MSLIVKHNKADHTHENEQFRRVASSLKKLFEEKGWSGLLIGNPFNENYPFFQPDAILLYDYGLIIIDFKDYSGTIRLPDNRKDFENSPWYIESDKDKNRTLVKAGNRFINPFKQLNSYRQAFKEIVRSERLTGLIDENQTFALNIFSGPLTIENSVPKEIPFYKLIQESDLATFLYDYSSKNKYSDELANALLRLFNAEDWEEHIEIPKVEPYIERIIEIEKDVQSIITDFIKTEGSGILILESEDVEDRDNWVQYISINLNISQVEIWVYSNRIARNVSKRSNIKPKSLYNIIYDIHGGYIKEEEEEDEEIETTEQENKESNEQLLEIIPIRRLYDYPPIDESAVIILHEAHLITRSFNRFGLRRYGSGRLLEDLLKFLRLTDTKRKLICIGDPYSLSYGNADESAISIETIKKLYNGNIVHYRKQLDKKVIDGKDGLKNILTKGIKNKLFNHLEYPWKEGDLIEIKENEIPNYLSKWFSAPLDNEPKNIVMVYSNEKAKKISELIKKDILKNGEGLAKNDLLILHNTINIEPQSVFSQPTKLYNGMFLLVEEVKNSITESISIGQGKIILLKFTKIKAKCLSIDNNPSVEVWVFDNYLENAGKLSDEEEIAFKKFVKKIMTKKMKEQPFEESEEYKNMLQNPEYERISNKIKDLKARLNNLKKELKETEGKHAEKEMDAKYRELKEIEERYGKLKETEKEIKRKYKKSYRNKIWRKIIQTDPLINSIWATYGWTLTVHKCLGSYFNDVILYAYQGGNRGISNEDYFRWLYSGVNATSCTLYVVNPQTINPLMHATFEDRSAISVEIESTNRLSLSYPNYKVPDKFLEKIPSSLNDNVKGSICELAQLLEPFGYLLESVKGFGEFLTKAYFSTPTKLNQQVVISFHNKSAKDNWVVSSIRVEKADEESKNIINQCIETLFREGKPFPNDFRKEIYEKWKAILNKEGLELKLIESHNYQDVFYVFSETGKAKLRVWYGGDGFINKISIIEKSDENLSKNIKKWLIDEYQKRN
jgi:hypothetical protein